MKMKEIPHFPEMKPLEFSDRVLFERHTYQFDPYADYIFNNFYSWDTEGVHALAQLNGNLVLQFADYITGKPFLSFIGTKKANETVSALVEHARRRGVTPTLKLVPEVAIQALNVSSGLRIFEDRDSYDYIFSIPEISHMSGRDYKNKRRAAKKCQKLHRLTIVDRSSDRAAHAEVEALLEAWKNAKSASDIRVDMKYEKSAIVRMLDVSFGQPSVRLTVAYLNDEPVGFSVDEVIQRKHVLSHYFKTLPQYKGLTEYLNREVAAQLEGLGCEYWNWQQDLGIEALRDMKLGYRPMRFLKKFCVAIE